MSSSLEAIQSCADLFSPSTDLLKLTFPFYYSSEFFVAFVWSQFVWMATQTTQSKAVNHMYK